MGTGTDEQQRQTGKRTILPTLTARVADMVMVLLVVLTAVAVWRIYHRPLRIGKDIKPTGTPITRKTETHSFNIDVNHASMDQLQALPGIGAVKARAIVDYRRQRRIANPTARPFTQAEDLLNVHGIGPKLLEKIRPHLRFSGQTEGKD